MVEDISVFQRSHGQEQLG